MTKRLERGDSARICNIYQPVLLQNGPRFAFKLVLLPFLDPVSLLTYYTDVLDFACDIYIRRRACSNLSIKCSADLLQGGVATLLQDCISHVVDLNVDAAYDAAASGDLLKSTASSLVAASLMELITSSAAELPLNLISAPAAGRAVGITVST